MKAIKIWNHEVNKKDTYLDFKGTFSCKKQGKVLLRLSCDSVFTVYINNEMVGFGNCANFPKRKLFYTFELTKYVKEENELLITVWQFLRRIIIVKTVSKLPCNFFAIFLLI